MAVVSVNELIEKASWKPGDRYYENLRETVRFLSSELGIHLVPVIPLPGVFCRDGKDLARGKSPSVWLENGLARNLSGSDRQTYKPNHALAEPSLKLLKAVDVAERLERPIGLGTLGRDDIAILDFDSKHFDDADHCSRVVEEWRTKHGLDQTYAEKSPTGGWHVWVTVRSHDTRRNFTLKGHTLENGDPIDHMGEVLWAGSHCVIAPTARPDGSYLARGPYKFENLSSLDEVGVSFIGANAAELCDVQVFCEELEESLAPLRRPVGTEGVPRLSKLLRGKSRDLYGGAWRNDQRWFKPGTKQPDRSKVLTTVLNEMVSWLKWLGHNGRPFVDDMTTDDAADQPVAAGMRRFVGELEAEDKFDRVFESVVRNVGRLSLLSRSYSDANAQQDYRRSCISSKSGEEIAPKDVNSEASLVGWLLARHGTDLKFNRLTQEVEIDGHIIEKPEHLYIRLARDEQVEGVGRQQAMDCFAFAAGEQPYHPVQDYLDSVRTQLLPCRGPADGTELVPVYEIGQRYYSVADPFQSKLLGKHLMAAVERVFNPGCQYDQVLVFRGAQGVGKTRSIQSLVPDRDLYVGVQGVPAEKDVLMQLNRCWLMELEEVDGVTSKRSAQQLKAFLSKSCDVYRAPYAAKPASHPRQQVLFATTNEDRFLIDATGERRWWVADVDGPIDHERIRADRDLIWASVLHAIDSGEDYRLLPVDYAKSAENASSASKESALMDQLESWLGDKPWVTERVILSEVLNLEGHEVAKTGPKAGVVREVTEVLKRLGWTRAKQAVRDLCGQKNTRDVWFAPGVTPTRSGPRMLEMFEERKLPVPVFSEILCRISFSKVLTEANASDSRPLAEVLDQREWD